MKTITNKSQLIDNIETIENYLVDGTEQEKDEIRKLIRKGKCFLAYKVNEEVRFAPSRFLGYINNNLNKHNNAKSEKLVDGKETNVLISKVLSEKLITSPKLDNDYVEYCNRLGEEPSNYSNRRFWEIKIENDFKNNEHVEGQFPEGKIVERIHITRERNRKVIEAAKHNFKLKHGKLFCQVCTFDFKERYGELGEGFIEGHHTIPVSELKPKQTTSPDDIALLCPNCHRMVHKKRPWLSIDKLKTILK